jgi:putative redox protein
MVKMTGIYKGEKRCALEHTSSKSKISTDAPKDNNGKGESFSPTDLTAASLGSCMLTVMAIAVEKEKFKLQGSEFEVEKHMQSDPRKIAQLKLKISVRTNLPKERRPWLEKIAHECPVRLSLHPDIKVEVEFIYYMTL